MSANFGPTTCTHPAVSRDVTCGLCCRVRPAKRNNWTTFRKTVTPRHPGCTLPSRRFLQFGTRTHGLHAQVLRVRQVCVQCWTEGAHSPHGQSPRRKQRVLHSTLISASRFLLEKSQVRSLEIHPTRLGARARAQRRASVIYSHTQNLLISSLRRVTVYVTFVKTTSMDDTRTLQRHSGTCDARANARASASQLLLGDCTPTVRGSQRR